jgi:hypothetical protein
MKHDDVTKTFFNVIKDTVQNISELNSEEIPGSNFTLELICDCDTKE